MTAFSKNQRVTLFRSWDDKGTVAINEMIVYSCGARQMVLANEDGEKFGNQHFLPQVEQYGLGNEVHPRMSRAEAEAHAMKLGAAVVASERERMGSLIERNAANAGYCAGMRKSIDALHEPRFVWKSSMYGEG